MNRSSFLIKDTIMYGIATFGPKLVSFILLPIFTNYFTTNEYGKFELINISISLLIPYLSFEILNAVYRWIIIEKDRDKVNEAISTGFFFTIRNLVCFNVVAAIISQFINFDFALLAIIVINIEIISNFMMKCLRGLGYNKLFAVLGIIQTLVTISTQIICIFIFRLRIETLFIGIITGGFCIIIIVFVYTKFYNYLSLSTYSKDLIKLFLSYSIPMIPSATSWWIMNASDRYVISIFLGLSANGIYSVANKLPTLINLLKTIFQLSWQDSAIINYSDADRDQYYSDVFKYYYRFAITSCMLLISITPILFKFLVAKDFYVSWKYTEILYVGALFAAFSSFWGAAYYGSKNTKKILQTTIIGAVVNLLVNLALIELLGLYAAAISTVFGYFVMWITRVLSKNNGFKIVINKIEFITLIAITLLILLLTYTNNLLLLTIAIIISSSLFCYYNKSFFSKLYQVVSKKQKKSSKHENYI